MQIIDGTYTIIWQNMAPKMAYYFHGGPRYDNGNDDWLAMNGNPREWAVAFHGSKSIEGNQKIAETREIRPGNRNLYDTHKDVNPLSDNYGNACGKGSYFSDDIEIPAHLFATKVNDRTCVFQARLCPKKIRIPEGNQMYRIVNEAKYARPYGICIQK